MIEQIIQIITRSAGDCIWPDGMPGYIDLNSEQTRQLFADIRALGSATIYLMAQRKKWDYVLPPFWTETHWERFEYVECGIYTKPIADLTDEDKELIRLHGEKPQGWIEPISLAAVKAFRSSLDVTPVSLADAADRLADAVAPFDAAVFNDNGDVTVSSGHIPIGAWLILSRRLTAYLATKGEPK